jgi:CubicO group peptidase (beta-lactamase class C family)
MNRKFDNNYGITDNAKLFINQLEKQTNTIVTLFGSPYALKYFDNSSYILMAYGDEVDIQDLSAQLLFGGIPARGILPVSASPEFKAGIGLFTNIIRLHYSDPLDFELNPNKFKRIDSIVKVAMRDRVFPGCRVMAVKDNHVVYNGVFGFYTYDQTDSVREESVYDVASITKSAATTLAVMKLYEQKKIKLTDPLSKHLKWLSGTNKADIIIKDLLLHQAGLKAWIPFYKNIPNIDEAISSTRDRKHYIQIAENMYLHYSYMDTIKKMIAESPVNPRKEYLYSDLDFILLGWVVESVTNTTLNDYVHCEFYAPLGIHQTTFLPLQSIEKKNIVPSNYDSDFRRQKLQGYVHDPTSAMFGGVAGHAGLFSDANGLAIIHQMLLNYGTYGGIRLLDSSTVVLFTSKQSNISRRGLGFDKHETDVNKKSPCTDKASGKTFGHQGFTGTCIWSDPEVGLTFIFLSNRTFPDDSNSKINTYDIRGKIHATLYDALVVRHEKEKRY